MKTFYGSLVAFAIVTFLIVANAIYIRKTATALEARLTPLLTQDVSTEQVEDLEKYWEKRKTVVGLSMPATVGWNISDRIIEIRSAAEKKDAEGLDLAVRLALEAVARMRKTEGFAIEALL